MFRQRFMSLLSTRLKTEHTSLNEALSRLAASSTLRAALGSLAASSAVVLSDFAPSSQVEILDDAPPPPGTFSDAAAAAEHALKLLLEGTDGAAATAAAEQSDDARSVSPSDEGSYSSTAAEGSGDEEMGEADFG